MIVYVDIAFLLALFQDCGLLAATGVCMKEKIKMRRIVTGGVIGAAYQLVCIFYPAGSVLTSVIVAFLQIAVTYRTDRIKNTVMYIALAVFTAGIMQITENVFSGLMFSCCLIASPYVVRLIKKYLSLSELKASVEILKNGRKTDIAGFVDSGNSSGIIIIGRSHAVKILGKAEADTMLSFKEGRYSAILCTTVKGTALLPVFTPDYVMVNSRSCNIKIGVMQGNLPYALLPVGFFGTGDMDDKETDTEAEKTVLQKSLLYRRKPDTSCTIKQGR